MTMANIMRWSFRVSATAQAGAIYEPKGAHRSELPPSRILIFRDRLMLRNLGLRAKEVARGSRAQLVAAENRKGTIIKSSYVVTYTARHRRWVTPYSDKRSFSRRINRARNVGLSE